MLAQPAQAPRLHPVCHLDRVLDDPGGLRIGGQLGQGVGLVPPQLGICVAKAERSAAARPSHSSKVRRTRQAVKEGSYAPTWTDARSALVAVAALRSRRQAICASRAQE
jgi:hypothetical protein